MSNIIDSDAGSELFSSYEAELRLVQADLRQKLDQLPELSGEPRKATMRQAERALDEAIELVSKLSFFRPVIKPILSCHAFGELNWSIASSIRCAWRKEIYRPVPSPRSINAFETSRRILTPLDVNSVRFPTIANLCLGTAIRTMSIRMINWNSATNCSREQSVWNEVAAALEKANEWPWRRRI